MVAAAVASHIARSSAVFMLTIQDKGAFFINQELLNYLFYCCCNFKKSAYMILCVLKNQLTGWIFQCKTTLSIATVLEIRQSCTKRSIALMVTTCKQKPFGDAIFYPFTWSKEVTKMEYSRQSMLIGESECKLRNWFAYKSVLWLVWRFCCTQYATILSNPNNAINCKYVFTLNQLMTNINFCAIWSKTYTISFMCVCVWWWWW